MNLENRLNKKRIFRRFPTNEVLHQVNEGKKFVVVNEEFDTALVPQGYTLINMNYKGDVFRALIPQQLLWFMANAGEGAVDEALDDIADFYGEAENFEDEMIAKGNTSVQEADWATSAKNAYETYLVNKLTRNKKGERDENGEPIPEFNPAELKRLGIEEDDYVGQRVRAIAAAALGKKSEEEVKKYKIEDVLKHVTIQEAKTVPLTKEEFQKITCWAGSHYEIKPEYKNKDDANYSIDKRHDKNHMVGTKTTKFREAAVLDTTIAQLEKEIIDHRKAQGKQERHDQALIRQYVNLTYIAKEDPKAQLNIMPQKKEEGK